MRETSKRSIRPLSFLPIHPSSSQVARKGRRSASLACSFHRFCVCRPILAILEPTDTALASSCRRRRAHPPSQWRDSRDKVAFSPLPASQRCRLSDHTKARHRETGWDRCRGTERPDRTSPLHLALQADTTALSSSEYTGLARRRKSLKII